MTTLIFELPAGDDEAEPVVVPVTAVDHETQAKSRLIARFQKPNIIALVSILARASQDLENTMIDMLTLRGIDFAEGAQLDQLGVLVNQLRNGFSDELYRRHIRARISANRSRGLIEDILRITTLVVYDVDATIELLNEGAAGYTVRVLGGDTLQDEIADLLIDLLRVATAAGVKVNLISSEFSPEEQFGFELSDGLGFTVVELGSGTATTSVITLASTASYPASGTVNIEDGANSEELVGYGSKTATDLNLSAPLAFTHTSVPIILQTGAFGVFVDVRD